MKTVSLSLVASRQQQATQQTEQFALVQMDDQRFYPAQILWGGDEQALLLRLLPNDASISGDAQDPYLCSLDRQEAIQLYQDYDEHDHQRAATRWQMLTAQSNVYPERCSHYREVIEDITGASPTICIQGTWVFVGVKLTTRCRCGSVSYEGVFSCGTTLEDALEAVANHLYLIACSCAFEPGEQGQDQGGEDRWTASDAPSHPQSPKDEEMVALLLRVWQALQAMVPWRGARQAPHQYS